MKILFACGGTAGHINPALAVAGDIRGRHPEAEILFAGNPKGMEARLVPAAGYTFRPIEIMGIQRQLNWFNIKYNARSIICLTQAWRRSKKLLREFEPDLVIGTGGYVSAPILYEAARMQIPTLAHESNAFPGISTKFLARFVDTVLLAVEEAAGHLPKNRARLLVTGNPVRGQILFADRARARAALGVGDRVCIVSFGGSLGAKRINEAVAELMSWESRAGGFYHVHATGSYDAEWFDGLLERAGVQDRAGLDIRTYIHDMPDCLAAADLVICRSGAMTLTEIEASGTAALLIPSPNVAENHQFHNAMVLQNHDAAVVIEEKDLTPARLRETVERLCADRRTLERLGKNARHMAILDANEQIYKQVLKALGQ